MSPAVLVLMLTFASGSGAAVTIDMPSMSACYQAQTELNREYHLDTSARCINRREGLVRQ
jgi:hypothetical protein